MLFAWDEEKNRRNKVKHNLSFETASHVFEDHEAISDLDRIVEGEERWQTLGLVNGVVLLEVVHTFVEHEENQAIRIVSARKATPRERKNL